MEIVKFKISNLQSTRLPSPEGEVNGGQAMERSDIKMSPQQWKTKLAFSAGGVIYKIDQDQIYVALTARRDKNKRKIWCLPKGIIEKREKIEEAALREVEEETGLSGEIITKIDQIDYWFYWPQEATRYHKTVYFYLIKFLTGDTRAHDEEVEAAEWFSIEEALEKLTFKNEREIVRKALLTIYAR